MKVGDVYAPESYDIAWKILSIENNIVEYEIVASNIKNIIGHWGICNKSDFNDYLKLSEIEILLYV